MSDREPKRCEYPFSACEAAQEVQRLRARAEKAAADAEGWRNGQEQAQRDFDAVYAANAKLMADLNLALAECRAWRAWDQTDTCSRNWTNHDYALTEAIKATDTAGLLKEGNDGK